MPGFILHFGATVLCSHGGQATLTVPNPKVAVSGQFVATVTVPYAIAGCSLGTSPCASGQFTTGATRVFAGGLAVAIMPGGMSTCIPTGTPLLPLVPQLRVLAT